MTWLKMLVALCGAAVCLIAYLGLSEGHARMMRSEPHEGRVVAIEGDVVLWEAHYPDAHVPDEDGDYWFGPYRDEDMPADARAALRPGSPLVLRGHTPEQSLSGPSPLLLLGFVVCLVLAAWAYVAPIRMQRALEKAASDPLRLIELMVKRSRGSNLTAAFVFVVMGAFLVSLVFFVSDGLGTKLFIAGLGLLSAGFAVPLAVRALRLRDPKNAPVVRAIRTEPERIVWIYEHVVTVNGFPAHTVFCCRDDGERFSFQLVDLAPDALLSALVHMLPHATLGYTPELEAAFARSPASLRGAPPASLRPAVGIGDVEVGMRAAELADRRGIAVADTGFTDLGDGTKVQCFDGEVTTVYVYTGVVSGCEKAPIRGFGAAAETPDGIRLGATAAEVLRARPTPARDETHEHIAVPDRVIEYPGITFRFEAASGAMSIAIITRPDNPIYARMGALDRVDEAVVTRNAGCIEGLRDEVTRYGLARPLLSLYDQARSWEERAMVVQAVQDQRVPEWRDRMRHFLDAPTGVFQGGLYYSKVVALTHLDESLARFDEYWASADALEERAAALRAQAA